MADWAGQKRAEALCVWLTSLFGAAGFVLGYWRQDFGLMMKVNRRGVCACKGWRANAGKTETKRAPPIRLIERANPHPHNPNQVYGVGVALAGAATIPDWPWLNRHPLAWLPATEDAGAGGSEPAGTRRATTQRRLPVIE